MLTVMNPPTSDLVYSQLTRMTQETVYF